MPPRRRPPDRGGTWVSAAITSVLFVPLFAYLVHARCERAAEREAGADPDDAAGSDLAERVLEAARERRPDCTFEREDARTLSATCKGGTTSRLSLDNLAAQTEGEPDAAIDRAIDEYLAAFDAKPPDDATIRANLVPVLRPAAFERCLPGQTDDCPGARPFAADLVRMYAVDTPSSLHYPTPSTLQRLALDEAELEQLAHDNLAARMPPVQMVGEGTVRMITAGGTFESSLLLLPTFWEELGVAGEPLAIVVARDVVLVADSANPNAVAELRSTAAAVGAKLDGVFSTAILRWSDGAWAAVEE